MASWDDIRAGLSAAPEVAHSPSMAAAFIQGTVANPDPSQPAPDVAGTAQGLAGSALLNAADHATQAHKSRGWFSGLVTGVTHTVSGVWDSVPGHDAVGSGASAATKFAGSGLGAVAKWANYPLSQVQHTYRYYREVQRVHGDGAAIGELLQNSWGGLNPGGAVTQPYVQHVTDQAAGVTPQQEAVQQNVFTPSYADLWDKAAGINVSPGRDLADIAHLPAKSLGYKVVSGTGDAAFDIGADPLLKLGSVSRAITGSARALQTVQDVERVAQGAKGVSGVMNPAFAPVRRAIEDIAATKSAARIVENYPSLGLVAKHSVDETGKMLPGAYTGQTMADDLAKAHDFDSVVDVLRNYVGAGEFQMGGITPSYALTKVPFRKFNDAAKAMQMSRGTIDSVVKDPAIIDGGTSALRKAMHTFGRTVNSFTNHAPTSLDTEGHGIGTSEFHPLDPKAPQALNAILRYSQSPEVANQISDAFRASTSIADRTDMWTKGIVAMAHGLGVEDPDVLNRLAQDSDQLHFMSGAGKNPRYGVDHLGNDLSTFPDGAGNQVTGPLFTSQGGNLIAPSYTHVLQAARATRKWTAMYGNVDDFAYRFTSGFFKPGALLSLGFPTRTALNELVTQVMGQGGAATLHALAVNTLGKVATGTMKASASAAGIKLDTATAQSMIAAMFHSADRGWIAKVAGNDKYAATLLDFYARHPGTHDPSFALAAAGHNMRTVVGDGDLTGGFQSNAARLVAPANKGFRFGPDWSQYTHDSGVEILGNATAGHAQTIARDLGARVQAQAYRAELARGATADEAQQAAAKAGHKWLTETPEGVQAQDFLKRSRGANDESDPLMHWANARAAAIRGVTTNKDGETIKPILDGIADFGSGGKALLAPDRLKEMGLENLPLYVPGQQILPAALPSTIARMVSFGFDRVITPTMQALAREPMFLQKYVEEREAVERLGMHLTDDEMSHMAASRAAIKMVPQVHNVYDRSQFAVLARNFIPFYFAREQAYRRLAQSIGANPFGFRKLQLAAHGMKDAGFVHTDPQTGQDYFNYPLSGELGRYIPGVLHSLGVNTAVGVPSGFRGDITSLASGGDIPGYENASAGWSPLVSMPLRGLAGIFPELKPAVSASVGSIGMSQPAWSAIVPNSTVRNAINAYQGDHTKAFAGAMIDAMQYQIAHGNTPPINAQPGDPGWQKWIDGIRSQTRIAYVMKTLIGVGAPASPILENGDVHITGEYQDMLNKYGLADGTQRFLTAHPNATAYTVFKSAGADGVAIPETMKAVQWANDNSKFIKANGEVGLLFIPQDRSGDPNGLAAYQQELASGLRHVKSPDEFAQQVMVQQGWNEYEHQHDIYLKAKAATTDPTALSALSSNWYNYVNTTLAPAAPLWFADYNQSSARAGQKKLNAQALVDMFKQGKQPDSEMTPLIGDLVRNFETYQAAYPNADSLGTSKTAMKDNWGVYLAQQVKEHPELQTVVNNVFKGL